MYVDQGTSYSKVEKWSFNSSTTIAIDPVMYMCDYCYTLFVDIKNNIYCSIYSKHMVIASSLNDRQSTWRVIAGTGTLGTTAVRLYYPRGIYVDTYLNLYVADYYGDRVQMFPFGQLNATTIIGNGPGSTIVGFAIDGPSEVVLDANGYVYITDTWKHRILRVGPNTYECIVACTGAGATSSKLSYPNAISFDSFGNIYISDYSNNRIQKFGLLSDGCGKTYILNIQKKTRHLINCFLSFIIIGVTTTTSTTTTSQNSEVTTSVTTSSSTTISYSNSKIVSDVDKIYEMIIF